MFKPGDIIYVYHPNDKNRQGLGIFVKDCPLFPGEIGFFMLNGAKNKNNAHYEYINSAEEFSPLINALNED
jgi:hypothetical protein